MAGHFESGLYDRRGCHGSHYSVGNGRSLRLRRVHAGYDRCGSALRSAGNVRGDESAVRHGIGSFRIQGRHRLCEKSAPRHVLSSAAFQFLQYRQILLFLHRHPADLRCGSAANGLPDGDPYDHPLHHDAGTGTDHGAATLGQPQHHLSASDACAGDCSGVPDSHRLPHLRPELPEAG